MFKGTDKYWQPTHAPVKQVFIHHTVTANYEPDPTAAVRAIWDFHSNARGWGDIGYNYLVDHNGNIYQGRFGGDNAVGGHVLAYNKASLGVALLGCFDSNNQTCRQLNGGSSAPAAHVLGNLSYLLSNKMTSFEIDPLGSNTFCDSGGQNCLNLPTITGHRSANQTGCPGDLTVGRLQDIRNLVSTMNGSGWTYSAKQLSYSLVDLSANDSLGVTLRFKNTGRVAWARSGNTMSLYTMEPPGKTSVFQGTGWLSNNKPARLNESVVNPGQIGSFTFNIKRPNLPNDYYHEYVTLISNDGNTPGSHYAIPIRFFCSIGQSTNPRANGLLIRDPNNGKVYVLEEGEKRLIASLLAAYTYGFNLNLAVNVTQSELGSLPNGPDLQIREGTLIKSAQDSKVYILDETGGGTVRRWIESPQALDALGTRSVRIHALSDAAVDSIPESTSLDADSRIPDGLLVRSSSDSKIYLTQNARRRWITSGGILVNNGYLIDQLGIISQAKLNQLPEVGEFNLLRSGSLIKTASSPSVYAVDIISGNAYRRLITSPDAFIASGFRPELILTVSPATLARYTNIAAIVCNQ
jgi:hypothetical protein